MTALVAIAHLRLRLEILQRNPHFLEAFDMAIDIRRPMQLAGLSGRMARAEKTEKDIEVTGKRYDHVLDAIDELHDAARGHVGSLEQQENALRSKIMSMVAGSNGDPNEPSESSGGSGQIIAGEPA